jgi:hypothetical protein
MPKSHLPPKACFGCDYLGQFSYYVDEILVTENNDREWKDCKFNQNPKMLCRRKYEADMEMVAEIIDRHIEAKFAEKEFKKLVET